MTESTQFLMSFPCYVVEMKGAGMVSFPFEGKLSLALLSDIDLAERFSRIVNEWSKQETGIVTINNEKELLDHVRTAKSQRAAFVSIDPEGLNSPTKTFKHTVVEIDHAILSLESATQN